MACFLRLFCLSILLLCVSAPSYADDYGDAPDGGPTGYPNPLFPQVGQFPTLDANDGIRFDDLTQATLGDTVTDEPDALVTNADVDDGIVNFVVLPISIPAPAIMTVNINGPATSAGGQYWVNVLIDMNMNGEWDGVIGPGTDEWAVKNFPVMVAPGVSQDIQLPPFVFANGNRLPDGAWMRIALTDTTITDTDWDGSGAFAAGEAEDHVIDLPRLAGPGGGPRKSCTPVMRCPDVVKLEDGVAKPFLCAIWNIGSDDCTFEYVMEQQTDGAEVTDIRPLAPTCRPPAGAGQGDEIGPCGPTAPLGPMPLGLPFPAPIHYELFTGHKVGDLPSRWSYMAYAVDPEAVISKTGVTIGFKDSLGLTMFVTDETPEKERVEEPRLDLEKLQGIKDLQTFKKLGVQMPKILEQHLDIEHQKKMLELYSPENIEKYKKERQEKTPKE